MSVVVSTSPKQESNWGDTLLMPTKWCHKQWYWISSKSTGSIPYVVTDVAFRIVAFVPLVIVSIGAFLLGAAGLAFNPFSLSYREPPLRDHPLFLDGTTLRRVKFRPMLEELDEKLIASWPNGGNPIACLNQDLNESIKPRAVQFLTELGMSNPSVTFELKDKYLNGGGPGSNSCITITAKVTHSEDKSIEFILAEDTYNPSSCSSFSFLTKKHLFSEFINRFLSCLIDADEVDRSPRSS